MVSLPEYGFSSKILSASKQKKKKFVPTTPAKRNVKGHNKYSQSSVSRLGGIAHHEDRYSATQVKVMTTTVGSGYHEHYDIYSPIAYVLKFYEEIDPQSGEMIMKVDSIPSKPGRFENEFVVVSKLGEGSFGEAYKVRHRFDGRSYAVKKAKE